MTYAGGRVILDADSHVMELGNFLDDYMVSWMHHLDYAHRAFRRTEEPLRRLQDQPSDYVHRHLKFTPLSGRASGLDDPTSRRGAVHVLH